MKTDIVVFAICFSSCWLAVPPEPTWRGVVIGEKREAEG